MSPGRSRSLLRSEAEERSARIEVTSMRIELDLTGASEFASTTTLEFRYADPPDAYGGGSEYPSSSNSEAPEGATGQHPAERIRTARGAGGHRTSASVFVDFAGTHLDAAILNGQPLDRGAWQDRRLPLGGLLPVNTLTVQGRMAYSNDGEGLHRHVDPADGLTYLYAMSFLDAGPRWFACFDQPDLKAPYEVLVTAPPDWLVFGNGPSEQVAAGRWRIATDKPLSTYFVSLVAGPYATVTAEHDGIPLTLLARQSLREVLEAESADILKVTAQSFDYYHRIFGVRYPFGSYHQAFVPDFNAGAMENPGCVTFRDSYLFRGRATRADRASRAGVVAHEMAHQWFGDLVTMRWWDDLWLNESFAEYMAHRCCTEATSYALWTEFGIQRKQWGSAADQSPSTHPVAGSPSADAASALQNFDGISYAKGAAVLRQLVAYVGDAVFLAGLRAYFDRYAYKNAELADLIGAWIEAGAVDLDAWTSQWLRLSGMDTLDVVADSTIGEASTTDAPVQARTRGKVVRRSPMNRPADRTHAVQVSSLAADGTELARVDIQVGTEPAPFDLPVGAVIVPDAADLTWAKIRFGTGAPAHFAAGGPSPALTPQSDWSRVAAVLAAQHPATRVVGYNAIRDAVRDAELHPDQALDLLAGALPAETEDIVVAVMLGFARTALAGTYCPIPLRWTRLARVHDLTRSLLAGAAPGSDRQLLAFKAAVASSHDSAELLEWRRGRRLPERLDLDPELIWAVVERLSSLGGDEREIERAEVADPSAAGREHAARARSSLPDAAAKERAWRLLTQPSTASAYELYATAEGFFAAHQTALTEPYAERYFTDLPRTAEFRHGWALARVATLAYPVTVTTTATLETAEAALLRPDIAAPIRRALVDGTDELRRAWAGASLPQLAPT